MSAADLASATIGQIAVRVHDLERAVAFYRDQLGLPLLFRAPPGLAFFRAGVTRLMLSRPEAEHDHPSSILYFTVPDVTATHAILAGRGVSFLDVPHVVHRAPTYELWMAFLRDSEGNTLAIMSEKPA